MTPVGRRRRRPVVLGVCAAALLGSNVTGCAPPLIGADLVSFVSTGKGLGEHALDAVTGEDCRVLEGVVRGDRAVCEPRGSLATEADFKGFFGPVEDDAAAEAADESGRVTVVCALAGGAHLRAAAGVADGPSRGRFRRGAAARSGPASWVGIPDGEAVATLAYLPRERTASLMLRDDQTRSERARPIRLLKIDAGSGSSFIGFDDLFHASILVSYFPEAEKLVLSRHGIDDKYSNQETGGLVLLGDCADDAFAGPSAD